MDISYKGANCIEIVTKKATMVIDGAVGKVGLKDVVPKDAVQIATHHDYVPSQHNSLVVDGPGEYEINDITVVGVPAQRHLAQGKEKEATMYRIVTGEVTVVIVGHVADPLTDDQLEKLGVVDIAIVPVGGSGYTLDTHGAVEVVKQLDPKVVIPTHYADSAINYEVPQLELAPFIKELAAAAHEVTPKFKIKNGILPETFTLVELTRTA
jgi:L-ascorbate metabolism protein UlaG (beta-lactamase superfamily)